MKLSTLRDDFSTNTLSATWTETIGASSGVTNGRLEIDATTSYPAVYSTDGYDATNSGVIARIVPADAHSHGSMFYLRDAADGNRIGFAINNLSGAMTLDRRERVGGGPDSDTTIATYDADAHLWLQIREEGGTVYLDTSADGRRWVQRDSVATAFTMTTVHVVFQVGYWDTGGGEVMLVDDIGGLPALPGTSLTRVQFTRGTNSITVDAPCERRWVAPVTGEAGEATIRLPRDSAANSDTYLNRDGGSWVRVMSEGGSGQWTGIVLDTDDSDPYVLQLTAYQPAKVLGKREVEYAGTLTNVSAGKCATEVLRGALSGVRGLSMQYAPFEGGVLAGREFDPNGPAWGGLTALMDNSDGELHITAAGDCQWVGPLACARRYDTLLVEGGNFQNVSYQPSGQNRVAEVTSGDGPERYTARRGDAARDGWPAQATVTGGAQAAQRELEARSRASIVISGGVTSEHWGIRERDYVLVLVPRAGGTGRTHRCRVLGRSLADGDHLMMLELQVVRPVVATLVAGSGAGGRQRPAQRASADGQPGSFAQQFNLLLRLLQGGDDDPHRWVR